MKYALLLALLLLSSCRGHGVAPDHFHAFASTGDADTSGHTGARQSSSSSETTSFTLGWTWDLNRKADEEHQRREELYLERLSERQAPAPAPAAPERVELQPAAPEPKAAEPETKSAEPETPAPPDEPPQEKILGMPPWVAKLTLWCTVAGAVLGVLGKLGKLPFFGRKGEDEPPAAA
jgi:hypothetical protein